MKLNADDRSLRDILASHFFSIPRFQRPYSWEEEQVEELWQDAVTDNQGAYFIGSMVVYRKSKDTVAVVDGQQRLTTLMMLLSVVRNAATKVKGGTGLADGTHDAYIERKDEDSQLRYVLDTESSFPFLQDRILSRKPSEIETKASREEKALEAAHLRLTKYVEDLVHSIAENPTLSADKKAEETIKELSKLRDKLLNLRLIFVDVEDQSDATTIFATLNSRGKDLDASDLVKAHLLNLLPKKTGHDADRLKWDEVVSRIDALDLNWASATEFLLVAWRSRRGNTSERRLQKDVRRDVRKGDAARYLDELVEDSKHFAATVRPHSAKWAKECAQAVASLDFFQRFGIRQPLPLVLSVVRAFRQKKIKAKQLHRVLRAVEDYHACWTVLAQKSSSGGMSAFFAKHGREIEKADKKTVAKAVDVVVAALAERRPSAAELGAAYAKLWFTEDSADGKKVVQYVLGRHFRARSKGGAVELAKMTVEHLEPQSGQVSERGQIGNLILADDHLNHLLGSKPWSAKRKVLKDFKEHWVPPEVLSVASWDSKAIQARTAALAEEARAKVFGGKWD